MRPPLIKTYPYDYPPLGLQEHPTASHRLTFKNTLRRATA